MQDHVDQLRALLLEKKMKLVTAESCTGGLLSATIIYKPGASDFFERGFVTYTNESKMECLDVSEGLLHQYGAVSEEVAKAMAEGALKNSHAHLAVAITGIAGPDGGTNVKPVGLVYIGYALRAGSAGAVQYMFEGGRKQIQTQAAATALRDLVIVLEQET